MSKLNYHINFDVLKKQKKTLLISSAIGVVLIASLVVMKANNRLDTIDEIQQERIKKIDLSHIAQGNNAESKWLQSAEHKLKELKVDSDKHSEEMQELYKQIANQAQTIEALEQQNANDGQYNQLLGEIDVLKQQLSQIKNTEKVIDSKGPYIRNYNLQAEASSHTSNTFNIENYLPAGSYVPATLISGVDASVGVTAQSDPRPVLLRITGNARSAVNDTEIQKIDLKGCTAIGAATGDLSSERVYIRVLKITCSREEGTVFENNVEGYISSLGKTGIRGSVISREGDFISQSFFSGLVSGLGGGISQSFTAPTSIFGTTESGFKAKDIAGQGLGSGVSKSSDRVSEYLMKRAEQYQPVVSINAGAEVEIVFNNGVHLGIEYQQNVGAK